MPKISNMRAQIMQSSEASRIMDEYEAYARKLGCQVEGDAIICTATQAKILNTWWKTRTHALAYSAGEKKVGK